MWLVWLGHGNSCRTLGVLGIETSRSGDSKECLVDLCVCSRASAQDLQGEAFLSFFRWIGGSDDGGKHLRKIAEDRGLDVRVKSSTDQLHNVAVQGPKSRETLSKII